MRILFIRHAKAKHNEAAEIYGELAYFSEMYRDSPLTHEGRMQARRVRLPFVPNKVYSSPLRRCIQTADEILHPSTELILLDELIERQGHHPCNIRSSLREIYDMRNNLDTTLLSERYLHHTDMSERESYEKLGKRVLSATQRIIKESQPNDNILIVTHWDVIKSISGKEDIKNCEFYEYPLPQ